MPQPDTLDDRFLPSFDDIVMNFPFIAKLQQRNFPNLRYYWPSGIPLEKTFYNPDSSGN
jgi:hypothetical protein